MKTPSIGEYVRRAVDGVDGVAVIAATYDDNGVRVLLPYQQRWIADLSQVKIAEKSRRVGLTWAEAADDALIAASSADAGGQDVWYCGYNRDMALEFIETVVAWAQAYQLAVAEMGVFVEDAGEVLGDDDKKNGITAFKVRFASGFKVVALSSRPSNFRGKQGIAVLDEFAFHGDKKELLKAAMAFLIWGGKVRIISTHDGVENEFNELITEIRAGKRKYSLHRITFDEAIDDGLAKRALEKQKKPWTPEIGAAWAAEIRELYGDDAEEELDVVPRSSSGTFLSSALIEARMQPGIPVLRYTAPADLVFKPGYVRELVVKDWCEENLAPLLDALSKDERHAFGQDFARVADLSVIWPLAIGQDLIRRTPFLVELRNVPFDQQKQILWYIIDRLPNFAGGAMDAGGNGADIAETTMQRYGEGVIARVMLTESFYREQMPKYKAAYEDAMLEIPRDGDVLADHRGLRVVRGVARVPDARNVGADKKKRHCDSAIAGFLAYYATQMEVSIYEVTTVARGSRGGESRNRDLPPHDDDQPAHGRFGRGAF